MEAWGWERWLGRKNKKAIKMYFQFVSKIKKLLWTRCDAKKKMNATKLLDKFKLIEIVFIIKKNL